MAFLILGTKLTQVFLSNTDSNTFELLQYRMKSVAIGHLAILHTLEWDTIPSLKIYFDELQVIEGNALAFTNPAIEAALIHCRALLRSEEQTSELTSPNTISYAVFCLQKKTEN